MLSAVSEVQQGKHCRIPRLHGSCRSQVHRDSKQKGGCQGLGKGENGELVLNGFTEFSFARWKQTEGFRA